MTPVPTTTDMLISPRPPADRAALLVADALVLVEEVTTVLDELDAVVVDINPEDEICDEDRDDASEEEELETEGNESEVLVLATAQNWSANDSAVVSSEEQDCEMHETNEVVKFSLRMVRALVVSRNG